ncbi:MAG: family 43 glycosylhydrolase [Clostridia bacterium]|nr:family 43 glycosylhydrolase [Clostridia bacterium]
MNPILNEKYFVPDCEARVMPDGRLYIYGSWDIPGNGYCSRELHLFSTDDLENWQHHGVIFSTEAGSENGIPWLENPILFAPDAIYKDGKYYLYLCGPGKKGNYEGVAVASTPEGPYSEACEIDVGDYKSIDPAIFVDDDNQAYYFWGQFTLKGAKMNPDMKSIDKDSLVDDVLTEWEHGFHEGASIRKRGDKYYMVYTDISRGRATSLGYAVADKPLGPYKKCGIIVDNIGCDPESWNNHGSIACFKGKWYVFYHRSSQNCDSCRRVCIEPIEFDENGYIKEVEQTSQGVSKPIDARKEIRANLACRMFKKAYIAPIDGYECVIFNGEKHWDTPDFAEYKYIDFGSGNVNKMSVTLKGKGKITVKAEDNTLLGKSEYELGDFGEITFPINNLSGVHPVWVFIEGEKTYLKSFKFM